ncbi:MAG: DNA polymerase III subunit gamma/tau, partial [Candidatus Margulisbacteria bacterium]|nr:DNA polymerase III subunit gamma/tau [Candidatus Margulisiibacteriota bacterium]
MSYVSLYRKYRSQNFDEIIGQTVIVQTLKNAIKNNRLAHAYLFSGPRGTGKTSTARILAKALNCKDGPTATPCGKCDNCEKIRTGHAADVIEIDAASNRGIDEIRELRERVRYAPLEGRYKVYIIDEVHMLTSEAFNALLKTLEEPPSHTIFVLATTESQKVPLTIASRCQRLDFARLKLNEIKGQLQKIAEAEGFEIGD